MTELLYLEDAYLGSFSAVVTDHVEGAVILDKTAFYPGGGGQPGDVGKLTSGEASWTVLKTKRVQGNVGHFIDGEPPDVGITIIGEIDWALRYRLMRTHTAMHILCGVIWRDYQASVTGGNMQPLKGRMDLSLRRCAVSW
jgi:misacylated tRNA(Ala) deacylase